jgi:hypothetical protein
MRANSFSFFEKSSEGTPQISARNLPFWGGTHQKRLEIMVNLNLPVPPDNQLDQNMPNSLENREKRLLVGSRSVLELGTKCHFHDRTGRFWQDQAMRKT